MTTEELQAKRNAIFLRIADDKADMAALDARLADARNPRFKPATIVYLKVVVKEQIIEDGGYSVVYGDKEFLAYLEDLFCAEDLR